MTPDFLKACERLHKCVELFLNSSGDFPEVAKGSNRTSREKYPYDPELRMKVQARVKSSIARLIESISLHGLDHVAVSYNGGKDCLVMFVLVLAAIHELTFKETVRVSESFKLDSIFIHSEDMFPELVEFINVSTRAFAVNAILIKLNLKEGFEHYLTRINPNVLCIVIGVRHSDPHSAQLSFEQQTDSDWPRFTRIHPILDWSYVDVWDFIVGCGLDYCSLYDNGYTSLGGIDSTVPNKFLRIDGTSSFLPAYMLRDDADIRERAGRKQAIHKNDNLHLAMSSQL